MNQTLASRSLDSNFESESSLGSLMPSLRLLGTSVVLTVGSRILFGSFFYSRVYSDHIWLLL